MSPEMEILFGVCSSLGMHHFKKKMAQTFEAQMNPFMNFAGLASQMRGAPTSTSTPKSPRVSENDSENEDLPPAFYAETTHM